MSTFREIELKYPPMTPCQELRDMIVRHPPLLLYSIDTTIKPKVSALVIAVSRIAMEQQKSPSGKKSKCARGTLQPIAFANRRSV